MKQKVKTYTEDEVKEKVYEALDWQREKYRGILEYILNKNSKPVAEGGLDYVKAYEDIEDFCNYLED